MPMTGALERVSAAAGPPLSASAADLEEITLLRDDDCLLRSTFLDVLKHHHPSLAPKLDALVACADAAGAAKSADADFAALEKALAGLNPEEMIL